MTAYEMAMKYYPEYWNDLRIDALVKAGKLSAEEAEKVKSSKQEVISGGLL